MFNLFTSFLSFNAATPTQGYTVDSAQLSVITKTLMDNASVIVPWGIGIMAVFMGIRFIPKLLKMFARSG